MNLTSVIPAICIAIYIIIRIIFYIPGNEAQIQPGKYLSSLLTNIGYTLSSKGFFLNIIPTLLTMALYFMALKEFNYRNDDNNTFFTNADIIPLIGIFVISHLINVDYNIGRVSLHCFPIFLPLGTIYFVRMFENMKFKQKSKV